MTRDVVLLLLLGLAVAALVSGALATARPPVAPVPDRAAYLDRWQLLHGGYDVRSRDVAAKFVLGWLTVVHTLAGPLARRGVAPDAVTLLSAPVAGLVVVLADLGGRWPLAAGVLVVASGQLDNLDGCVAVLEDRVTRWGYVLDSMIDRLSDSAYLLAVVVVGCPTALAVACGLAVFLLEYLRARGGNAGGDGIGRVTVAERPTRVLLVAPALVLAGLVPAHAGLVVEAATAVLLVLTVVSLVQLAASVRGQLG